MVGVRVQFGRPEGTREVSSRVHAQLTLSLAQSVVDRVQARVNHPAAQTLKAVGVNQYAARVEGTRGGPGPIVPVRASVLRFQWRGRVVFTQRVDGAGFLPLIVAEGSRLGQKDADEIVQRIRI